jgi:hypothetical protein
MTQTRESRPDLEPGAATNTVDLTDSSITGPNGRRTVKQARRTLGAALAQGELSADLVAAAALVLEAGRTQ